MTSRVHNIPAHRPFVDTLAAALLARASGAPDALARMTVLLPTRRACRAMRDAFLRAGNGRPLLLPRLQPIGDVDEEELILTAGESGLMGSSGFGMPPPIDGFRRRILLSQFVAKGRQPRPLLPAHALWLAHDLAALIDEVETARLSFDGLAALVPDDYAEHWQETLRFLETVTNAWPVRLAQEGAANPAAHRNAALEARANAWRSAPPADPVIAAGSTGSIPATADLLAVIAGLPNGAVILPGLDRVLDDEAWQRVAAMPAHPQHGLARLLGRLGLERAQVGEWDGEDASESLIVRGRLLAATFHPAESRRPGAGLAPASVAASLRGTFRYVECVNAREEAAVIANVLREALETPARSAALVTPDRDLARRVAAALRRWQIVIDDSAGTPLAATPPGTFLRLVLAMAAEQWAPVPLLRALKHPIAACGRAPGAFRAAVRRMEIRLLRGGRPGHGIAGLRARLAATDGDAEIAALIDDLERCAAPLADAMAASEATVTTLWTAQLRAAETLAATESASGAERLWAAESGEAAAHFAEQLAAAADDFAPLPPGHYPALFDALLAGVVVRPRYGTHPRLSILGPLEARLQSFDTIVLGGLNEGSWPLSVPADPWMSRPMRENFGLPAAERRIGQAAHDFTQAAMAKTVVLTRSRRIGRQPTQPSRWLRRIEAELRGLGVLQSDSSHGIEWPDPQPAELVRTEQSVPHVPVSRPAPRPPLAARPRSLSVTAIETWLRDPYSIYARRILRLEPLEEIDADPGAADLGKLFHETLAAFVAGLEPGPLPPDALPRLLRVGDRMFAPLMARPAVWAFWKPRFERMAAWFVAREAEQRAQGRVPAALECRGSIELPMVDGPFLLRGIADRIDRDGNGALIIVDYKTGVTPSAEAVRVGIAPQLPLEVLLVARNGFAGVEGAVAALEYWRLTGRGEGGEVKLLKLDPAAVAQTALELLQSLIAAFGNAATPYAAVPHLALRPRFNDYEHLARVDEWLGGDTA